MKVYDSIEGESIFPGEIGKEFAVKVNLFEKKISDVDWFPKY